MPVRVVLDHPRRHIIRRLWQPVSTVIGLVLLIVGIAATFVAVPATLLVAGWLLGENVALEITSSRRLMSNDLLLIWAVAAPLAFVGVSRGLRLVRQGRTMVLVLRRFGHDEAQHAVTFAVTNTIGRSWRLVTLDDAEIAPVGVPTGTRLLFRSIRLAGSAAAGMVQVLLRVWPGALLGLWIVVGADLVRVRIWERAQSTQAWTSVLNPYLEIVTTTFDGRLPIEAIGPTLPGIFALLAVVLAGIVIGLGTALTAAPVAWAASAAFLFLFSFPADAVLEAERAKTREIKNEADIGMATSSVSERSRRVFGPQLVVLRVASGVWRQTVSRFASVSFVALIDVSEPTENLVWEIEELMVRARKTCVFIAQHDRALEIASGSGARTFDGHVASLLELDEILAYTTDRRGRRRFARALRGKLLSLTTRE